MSSRLEPRSTLVPIQPRWHLTKILDFFNPNLHLSLVTQCANPYPNLSRHWREPRLSLIYEPGLSRGYHDSSFELRRCLRWKSRANQRFFFLDKNLMTWMTLRAPKFIKGPKNGCRGSLMVQPLEKSYAIYFKSRDTDYPGGPLFYYRIFLNFHIFGT